MKTTPSRRRLPSKPQRVLFTNHDLDDTNTNSNSNNSTATTSTMPVLRQTKSSKRALEAAVAARKQAEEEQAKLLALKEEEERAAKLSGILSRLEQLRAHRRLRMFAQSFILKGQGSRNRRRRSSGMPSSLAVTPIVERDVEDESILEEFELSADEAARRVLDYAVQTGQLPATYMNGDASAVPLDEILRQRDLQQAQEQDTAVRIIVKFLRLVVASLKEQRRAAHGGWCESSAVPFIILNGGGQLSCNTTAQQEVRLRSVCLHRSRQRRNTAAQYASSALRLLQKGGRGYLAPLAWTFSRARRAAQFTSLRKVVKTKLVMR